MNLLSWLTLRGKSFAVAGLAALGCAIALGQQDILRVAVLLISLPLVCAALVARTQHQLGTARRIDPVRVPVGEEARVTLELQNSGLVPTGLLLAEDTLPRSMNTRPRFVLDRLESHGRREVYYRVRSDVRGRFGIGPLKVRLADPFGMCEITRSFAGTDDLIVVPVVEHLPFVVLGGEWSGGSDSHPSSIPSAGEDDIGTREYRHGDSLHRVHWRSTARRGELMVRREEHPRQTQATLVLDTRVNAHVGSGVASSLEWAISAAASLSVHLIRRGFSLRVVTDSGAGMAGVSSDVLSPVPDVEGLLLDALAMLTPSATQNLVGAARELGRTGGDSLLVALLGELNPGDAESMARRRPGTTTAIALLQRTSTWRARTADADPRADKRHRAPPSADREFDKSVALLRNGGWRVIEVHAGDRLPDLWPRVAGGAGLTAHSRAGAPATPAAFPSAVTR
ncbi:MAG: DUF58 domain-containing protein [Sporichthyaceae bacterium]